MTPRRLCRGATVLIKGTLTGVVTDVNGNFSLSTEDVPNITIVISFVGMKTREIVVDGNKPLEIVLLPNTEELGQVVDYRLLPVVTGTECRLFLGC